MRVDMNINKNQKDSIFTRLFSNKKEIISLYNAIKDTNYKVEDTDINIITLQDVNLWIETIICALQ